MCERVLGPGDQHWGGAGEVQGGPARGREGLRGKEGGHSDRSFVIVPQLSEAFFIFLKDVFYLLFKLGVFYCSFFNFSNSFLCPTHSAVELIHGGFWGVFWLLYFQF